MRALSLCTLQIFYCQTNIDFISTYPYSSHYVQNGNTLELVEQHKPFYEQDTLTRKMVKELVKEVRISSPTEIEIVWKFQEGYIELEQGFMPELNI